MTLPYMAVCGCSRPLFFHGKQDLQKSGSMMYNNKYFGKCLHFAANTKAVT